MLKIIKDSNNLKFTVEGEIIPAKVEIYIRNRRNVYDIYLKNNNEEKILSAKLAEIPDNTAINFQRNIDWSSFLYKVKISIRNNLVLYSLKVDVGKWTEPFSIPEYVNKYIEIIKMSEDPTFELKSSDKTSFSIYTKFLPDNFERKSINDEIQNNLRVLKKCHEKTISELSVLVSNKNIQTLFYFPEQIRVFCEQYLLYFAQFLQDLGINTTANLKEEAGKVLFSITPNDDFEALDKIREALAVYLNLPDSPIIYDDSFAAMRLQQQIENLQHSQKMTARELQITEKILIAQSGTIQEKNTIIAQKDSVIAQQNKVIEKITSPSIMIDSVENKEELEEIYDGLKIGESKFLKEQLGIHLNPAKIIKTAVKNTLGKDERKSVLGLDKEVEE
jgi:hypothetical protein